MRNSRCKDGKKKAEKAGPTEVVEGDRRVRENRNLEVSCTDFVHAWSPSWNGSNTLYETSQSAAEVTAVT
jgi:hypothetical protein